MHLAKVKVNNSGTNFKGLANNKLVLNSLETISKHPSSFIATTTLVASSVIRPFVISKTPGVDKENKKYFSTDAIASGLTKFALVEAISLPIEGAIKKIDNNPSKYLNKTTIENLKENSKELVNSKNYKFATQIIKQSATLISSIPKSVISVSLIPVIFDLVESKKNKKDNNKNNETKPLPFKGVFEKGVSKVLNSDNFQKIVKKNSKNSDNITRNMAILSDILLTSTSIIKTKTSKKIDENKKNPLIYNKLFSSLASVFMGYGIDKYAQAKLEPVVEKFKEVNKNDVKLSKYLEGINILRPTLIFAALYYGILPIFSSIFADKIDKFTDKIKKGENNPFNKN